MRWACLLLAFIAVGGCDQSAQPADLTAPSAAVNAIEGKPKPPASGFVLSLSARAWTLLASSDGTQQNNVPLTNNGIALTANFPTLYGNLGYLYAASPQKALSGTVRIAMTVTTVGAPVFSFATETWNTCPGQAEVRAILLVGGKHGIDWSSDDARWWSRQAWPMAGSGVLAVPLDPSLWSNVSGQLGTSRLPGWQSALANVNSIGLTFGGGCFFGHGVGLDPAGAGSAQFALTHYEVTP